MNRNGTQYYYIKNIQNDIIGILDNTLQQIVSYTYTSWGEIISVKDANGNEITDTNHIGLINPYLYRSYRYDRETGFYYLQSRYYNPEWGRFLNADSTTFDTGADLIGHNMYLYCANNPINNIDVMGESATTIIYGIGAIIGILSSTSTETLITVGELLAENLITKTDISGKSLYEDAVRRKMATESFIESRKQIGIQSRLQSRLKDVTKNKVIFPENPYDFNPKGLSMDVYAGSGNGRIIKWQQNGIPIFEWNEDFIHGPHYHVLKPEWKGKHKGPHYEAFMLVPEPWATQYFY